MIKIMVIVIVMRIATTRDELPTRGDAQPPLFEKLSDATHLAHKGLLPIGLLIPKLFHSDMAQVAEQPSACQLNPQTQKNPLRLPGTSAGRSFPPPGSWQV